MVRGGVFDVLLALGRTTSDSACLLFTSEGITRSMDGTANILPCESVLQPRPDDV